MKGEGFVHPLLQFNVNCLTSETFSNLQLSDSHPEE